MSLYAILFHFIIQRRGIGKLLFVNEDLSVFAQPSIYYFIMAVFCNHWRNKYQEAHPHRGSGYNYCDYILRGALETRTHYTECLSGK